MKLPCSLRRFGLLGHTQWLIILANLGTNAISSNGSPDKRESGLVSRMQWRSLGPVLRPAESEKTGASVEAPLATLLARGSSTARDATSFLTLQEVTSHVASRPSLSVPASCTTSRPPQFKSRALRQRPAFAYFTEHSARYEAVLTVHAWNGRYFALPAFSERTGPNGYLCFPRLEVESHGTSSASAEGRTSGGLLGECQAGNLCCCPMALETTLIIWDRARILIPPRPESIPGFF